MSAATDRGPAAGRALSAGDRWDRIEAHLEAVSEDLRELRGEVEPWARLAVVRHEERVEVLARKLAAARKVLGQ